MSATTERDEKGRYVPVNWPRRASRMLEWLRPELADAITAEILERKCADGYLLVSEAELATALPELLHDLDGTQHFITHEMGYDGEEGEGIECATRVDGHREDAQQLLERLAETP